MLRLDRVVGQIVQVRRIRDARISSDTHRLIKGVRKLAACFRQLLGLRQRGGQSDAYRSLHRGNHTIIVFALLGQLFAAHGCEVRVLHAPRPHFLHWG